MAGDRQAISWSELEPGLRRRIAGVSLVILLAIGFQSLLTLRTDWRPVLWRFTSWIRPPALFPFLDYPMYARAHAAGEAVPRYEVFAVLADGTELPMRYRDVDTSFFTFEARVFRPLLAGDVRDTLAFVDRFEQKTGVRVVALRLENHPVIIAANGVQYGAPEVVATVALPPERER